MEQTIEQPWALMKFLRFIIISSSARAEQIPIYNGGRLLSHKVGGLIKVKKLTGYGETLEEAQKMAGIKTNK